ncbi:LacI family DNA-binding transcriptional regulator [Paenibacillus spongiae]|uniref:LacI family transcriptional regulator n=1 Tax=Paenibacillus spongiae TaxID=2909671 RepID=A0ABY5S0V8_9BACL|nr:LacI family DNA-binding transcriptional regulator [Paenibacillus spongiae]UVI27487.1 LacI family transcriptional regulator [Paenibacillus spongiae]
MITIKDIAARAGVSFSTVSKALRNSPLVQDSTKRLIMDIAEEMGYRPNIAARKLVSKKSGAIGVVWPSIERTAPSSLLTIINAELELSGYTTLLSINRLESAIEIFHRFQVDAILVFGDHSGQASRLASLAASIPILIYGSGIHLPFMTVDVNRSKATRLAVGHLIEIGHRRIGYIGRPEQPDPLQLEKIDAFRAEMKRYGAPCPEDCIVPIQGMEYHDGYAAAKQLLQSSNPPTALISGSFDLTRGILKAITEIGLTVPRDLSVVSYDNIPQMSDLDIPMTVVGVEIQHTAQQISGTLIAMLDAPFSEKTLMLEPELIVRASTAPHQEIHQG